MEIAAPGECGAGAGGSARKFGGKCSTQRAGVILFR